MATEPIGIGIQNGAECGIFKDILTPFKNTLSLNSRGYSSVKILTPIDTVFVQNNQLTELETPEGVEVLSCEGNLLTELKIPDSLRRLWCDAGLIDIESERVKKFTILDIYYA